MSALTLPARVYGAADGLPGGHVHRIVSDARGFLWFATDQGLARFDGARFTRYGGRDGLPIGEINDVIVTRDGALWAAADSGVYRMARDAVRSEKPPFAAVPAQGDARLEAEMLESDRAGGVLVGTTDGVFGFRGGRLVLVPPLLPHRIWDDHAVLSIAQTPGGNRWVGTLDALWAVPKGGGPARRFESRPVGGTATRVTSLLVDSRRRLWIGAWTGLFRLDDAESLANPFDASRRLIPDPVESLFERPDGVVFAATLHSVIEFRDGVPPIRTSAADFGAPFEDVELRTATEDPAGNLWIGTAGGGAIRVDREGFVRYGREDGLEATQASALFTRGAGVPCVESKAHGRIFLACFDGKSFRSVQPYVPEDPKKTGWGTEQLAFEDRDRRIWLPTGSGLLRYPAKPGFDGLARIAPERTFDRKSGLSIDDIFRVFPDRAGDLWISALSPSKNLLARWNRESDSIEIIPEGEGPPRRFGVTAFGEDGGGDLWLGNNGAGLWRRRAGRLEPVPSGPSARDGWITSIYRDRRNRLWISTDRGGVFRFDDPESPSPRAQRWTTADGLSSLDTRGFAEDSFGRLYVLTPGGVDRFGESPRTAEHFTRADGLPAGGMAAIAGVGGDIWVAGDGGVARLQPIAPSRGAPVEIFFDDVEVSGERLPLPVRGLENVPRFQAPPGHNSLRFEIASPAWETRRSVDYRYRIEPGNVWTELSPDRVIGLPRLAPGRYRLEVEGVDSAGQRSRNRALAEFSIAAPVWRRPGFILLAAATLAAGAVAAHRARLAQVMRVERVRTRIAADLHDDIGAGLSEVAVLAEVVRRRLGEDDPESRSLMEEVARTARQLVDSMSEIVWSVDPRRDDLESLLARLRHFAATLAEARGIRFAMDVKDDVTAVPLEAGRRRDLYLLLKEAAHNAIRHAGAARVSLAIAVDHGTLKSEVVDDGRGFDPAAGKGHGLDTMRERARALGGALELASEPGEGTRVSISVPLAGPP